MKKKTVAFFIMALTFGGLMINSAFAANGIKSGKSFELFKAIIENQTKKENTKESSKAVNGSALTLDINGISLTVSPNGIMKRVMNGETTDFDYNTYYSENVTFLKLLNWNGSFAALVFDNTLNEKKVILSGLGTVWQEVTYDYFAESDINYVYGTKYKVNDIAVYGDQLYFACDDGIILVITPCTKCYKLKKVSDSNIASISFGNDTVSLNEGEESELNIPISDIRQDNIAVEEAINMLASGALFIDVRDESEFNEYHYENSINIPLSRISEIAEYDRDTVIIFYCKSGGRSQAALQEAQKMGFINVYNLGSVDYLVNQK